MTEPGRQDSRRHGIVLVLVAAVASFVAAALVFSVQPMATRMVLPRLGGSAAVWNTAVLFFQFGLLGGYLLTHLTTSRLAPRAQLAVHLGLVAVAALLLPLDIPAGWVPPTGSPVLWMLGAFSLTIGLPYLALSAISPLVQRWFALSDHRRRADPYFLYAASNAGSLLGLLAYPLVIEPRWSLDDQSRRWAVGYAIFAVAVLALVVLVRPDQAIGSRRAGAPVAAGGALETGADVIRDAGAPRPAWRQRVTWIGWAFLPSSLMLGVTTHVTTDIASVPLFWVIPLAIYLLTYIVAFGARSLPLRVLDHVVLATAGAAAATFVSRPPQVPDIAIHLAFLAAAGLAFHGRIAGSRPASSHLTEFFLCISIGGVLGGAFNALLAPVVFTRVLEYGIVLSVALLATWREVRYRRPLFIAFDIAAASVLAFGVRNVADRDWLVLVAVVALLFAVARVRPIGVAVAAALLFYGGIVTHSVIRSERSFYGAFLVREAGGMRILVHGQTLHGAQMLDPRLRGEPTAYYTRHGPLGSLLAAYDDDPRLRHIGVIGLGVGTVAAYSEPDRRISFFEIDAKIRDLALDRDLFTYLSDAPGPVDIVIGDGRLSLERRPDDRFGVLVVDAFSSDAIPVHLLTRQALRLYFDRLEDNGILALHISNKNVDLEPVVAAIADDLELSTAVRTVLPDADRVVGAENSKWVMLSRDAEPLAPLFEQGGWRRTERKSGVAAWTDDYSNIVSVLTF